MIAARGDAERSLHPRDHVRFGAFHVDLDGADPRGERRVLGEPLIHRDLSHGNETVEVEMIAGR